MKLSHDCSRSNISIETNRVGIYGSLSLVDGDLEIVIHASPRQFEDMALKALQLAEAMRNRRTQLGVAPAEAATESLL